VSDLVVAVEIRLQLLIQRRQQFAERHTHHFAEQVRLRHQLPKREPPPQRHVPQRNRPVRRIHPADDEQIRRHAKLLARTRQRHLDLVGRDQPLIRLDQRDQLAEAEQLS
jgi:hypothetical protein